MADEPIWRNILAELTRFATVSSESNVALIEYAEALLDECGYDTEILPSPDRRKANLVARIGPELPGGVALAGHTDVVPVAGQDWSRDPFELAERDGKLHARGTADMKGFVALALEAAATLDPGELERPLYLVFTYDEEVGCLGALALEDRLRRLPDKPRFALIGEPTGMELAVAHKGIQQMLTRVRGKPGHSSRPGDGANAIAWAARFISRIGETLPADGNEEFDPPGTTWNVGVIRGGEATNIIAEHCEFRWEFRHLPGQDPAAIHTDLTKLTDEIEAEMPGLSVENEMTGGVTGMQAGENRVIAAELGCLMPRPTEITAVPFVTEGGIFQRAGIPAVVCGPGELAQAHQPDEYVTVEAMEAYRAFLAIALDEYLQ